ncbi:MAG: HAD-IC family P-type ATPase, partial [Clostridia bacterium]|nr:HAD-IC family P-type ATPase [Clostridia bacterium]
DINLGLTHEQVEERDSHYLTNATEKNYSKSYLSIFCSNLFTFFNLLGLVVTVALIVVRAPISNFFYAIIYLANISIGIIQEVRAKHSIERLSLISSKTSKVLRNGEVVELNADDIVLDDIVLYEIGNQIMTDCVIVEGEIEVNESLLTGESVAIKKGVGDQLYAASFITSGHCKTQAIKVGKENYIQKLSAKAKRYRKPNSELMRSLSTLISIIGIIIVPLAVANVFKALQTTPILREAVLSTSGLIISMIPAGMFLLTSMALAVGVIRLARHNTLVQDLYSLEMLARVDVLCLDKTGTITDGRMKVNDCILLNNPANYTISEVMGSMLSALNDSNQTSVALYNHFGHSTALKPTAIVPFSSDKKLSAVTFSDVGTYAYGAPEFVLKEVPEKLQNLIRQYASMGLRVLILANSKSSITANGNIPAQMKPIALITIADSVRENAAATIKWFKDNDVAVKVISGDNPLTVSEIARRVGVANADKYISLEGMSERDVIAVADKYTVFGRVSPEQKAILIKSMKLAGHNVAMTGDGVNDILAMKEADCAVAMASGSDAACNLAHLVLTDNNFNSMPKVVQEGRRVINNIQKSSSLFLMKTLFAMMLAVLTLLVPDSNYPLETNSLMLVEVFVIGVPSFYFSLQANDKRVEGKFINYVISKSFPSAFLMFASVALIMLAQKVLSPYYPSFVDIDLYTTMMIYAVTITGTIMLYRICQPFNLYRSILYIICATAIFAFLIVSIFLGSDIIGTVAFTPLYKTWHHILIIVTILSLIIPISSGLDNAGSIFRKNPKNNKKSNED